MLLIDPMGVGRRAQRGSGGQTFFFASNLSEVTCDEGRPESLHRDAWLLSHHYQDRRRTDLAHLARRHGILISDNGNWSRAGKAVALAKEKDPTLGEAPISPDQRELLITCAQEIQNSVNEEQVLSEQVSLGPDYVIAPEDLVLPTLLRGGALPVDADLPPDTFRSHQRATLAHYRKLKPAQWGKAHPLVVLHAWNGASARAVGELAQQDELPGIAVSVGSTMKSRAWMDRKELYESGVAIEGRIPEKYPRSIQLVAETILGMGRPTHVHVLGTASPILIALFGFLLPGTTGMSVDSSGPLLDAQSNWVYGDEKALLKMRAEKLLAISLGENKEPLGKSPAFRQFNEKYPQRFDELRERLSLSADLTTKEIERRLDEEVALVRELAPFWSKMGSVREDKFRDLMRARTDENCGVLLRLTRRLSRLRGHPDRLQAWLEARVADYSQFAHPPWMTAVQDTYSYLLRNFPQETKKENSMTSIVTQLNESKRNAALRGAQDLLGDEPSGETLPEQTWLQAAWNVASGVSQSGILSNHLKEPELLLALESVTDRIQEMGPELWYRSTLGQLTQTLGTAVYGQATEAWAAGRTLRDTVGISPTLNRRIALMEQRLSRLLRMSRQIAASPQLVLSDAYAQLLTEACAHLPQLCADAASAPTAAQLGPEAPGIVVSEQARLLSLLAATYALLMIRRNDQRLVGTTAGIAARRKTLRRKDGPPGRSLALVPPLGRGKKIAVCGKVVETGWKELPEFPYGWAELEGGGTLILPHKRFRTRGVLPGTIVWAGGRIKTDFDGWSRALEVEAEGPGTHSGEVWQDWLATELRGAVDLRPGSLRLFWEMPDPAQQHSGFDLGAHLPFKSVKV